MDYDVEHNAEDGIHIVTVSGPLKRPDDSIVLQKLSRELKAESGYEKFLFDMREAEITGSTMDVFAAGQAPTKAGYVLSDCVALVYKGEMEDHRFMENVLVNRGFHVKVFEDMDQAHLWLKEN